ncbi:MAG: LysE family translocator [Candidatus Puniceispirillaceae bacterium]
MFQRILTKFMDSSTLISLATFAMVTAFTPGPNNVMLAASGANFGFRRTLPHIFGILVGFCSLVLAAGLGLATLFAMLPWLYDLLKIISFLFLLYLAWKIGSAGRTTTKDKDKPLSFVQAASFQLINPKGIMVIISSVSAYTSTAENVGAEVTILLFVFAIVTFCATCTWTVFGTGIAQLLTSHTRLRQFNVTMALLLVASLLPSILEPALMK